MDQDPIHCIFARGPKISIVDPDGVDPDSDLSAYQKTTFIQPNKFTFFFKLNFDIKINLNVTLVLYYNFAYNYCMKSSILVRV